jgi:thymidylate synthase (FAD)
MITIVEPGFEILTSTEGIEQHIERCGRTCYKSEDRITDTSADRFIRHLIQRGHESVLEHATVTVNILCSRACSHQLVRHRIAAYSQESQRYCDYGKRGLRVICPPSIDITLGSYMAEHNDIDQWMVWRKHGVGWEYISLPTRQRYWIANMDCAYSEYQAERKEGIPPEDARFVLPNACKTEVTSTYNLRTWRHVFRERGLNKHAQWEIRGIFKGILDEFQEQMPSVFGDLQ